MPGSPSISSARGLGELVGQEAVQDADLLGPAYDRLHAAALLPDAQVHSMPPTGGDQPASIVDCPSVGETPDSSGPAAALTVRSWPTRCGPGYVAECFWDGVREEDLHDVGRRIEASLVAVAGDGEPARYLGGLLVIDDEVVLARVRGPDGRGTAGGDHARLPFGRILRVAHAPWPSTETPTADEK